MSQHRAPRIDPETLPDPICDYCGESITEDGQECSARHDGRCAP